MEKKTYKLFHAGKLMPWGIGTAVKDARGFVFLAGTEGRDLETDEVVAGAEAQARMCLEKIKSNLETMGTSLDNIVKMIIYVAGEFPDGVTNSKTTIAYRQVKEEFFRKHAPELCEDQNPPPGDLIGVSALAKKEMLIEIAVIAVLPD